MPHGQLMSDLECNIALYEQTGQSGKGSALYFTTSFFTLNNSHLPHLICSRILLCMGAKVSHP